jgi:serine/threonine-protein kinase
MLVGQKLGPFSIDKELGSGAMGTVYRGRYTKTGQVLAIKIMAPGVGGTHSAAQERFEREAEILKQLRHPNIVRLFGVGRSQGIRYYAMEYVEGESLDKVLARRGRMSWQEVIDLGQQLCAALGHAHEKGIIHRDLKPSNLMLLEDGTLKLTDFGIAKDLDETGLTATNCTVGTAAYMSPEQCKGERHLTHKSDLYSLGIVFYELVTGEKPFKGESALEVFVQHVQGTFERPSRKVTELPVWLDTLIAQLLEKQTDRRPFDAQTVANSLATIQEKVEAQASAGVEAARARLVDRPRGQRNANEEDRETARLLATAGGKPRKKKPPKKKPLHERLWVRAAGLLVLLAAVITLLAFALRGPSADKLYQQAKRAMESKDPESARKPIQDYLARYGGVPGEKTDQVRKWAEDLDVAYAETLLGNHMRWVRGGRTLGKVEAKSEGQEKAFRAAEYEAEGERTRALKLWRQVRELEQSTNWGTLAGRHVQLLEALPALDNQLARHDESLQKGQEPDLGDAEQDAYRGLRYVRVGDLAAARQQFEGLRDRLAKETDPSARPWYLFAAWKARELKEALARKPQDEKDRKERVQALVETARQDLAGGKRPSRLIRIDCMDVVDLYKNDTDLSEQVREAQELLKAIAKILKDG